MTKQQKLTKVIERAVERGFDCGSKNHYGNSSCLEWFTEDYDAPSWQEILFDHDFAKAYWGEGIHANFKVKRKKSSNTCKHCGHNCVWYGAYEDEELYTFVPKCFEYHLQQSVLSKDPIDYYYKNE